MALKKKEHPEGALKCPAVGAKIRARDENNTFRALWFQRCATFFAAGSGPGIALELFPLAWNQLSSLPCRIFETVNRIHFTEKCSSPGI